MTGNRINGLLATAALLLATAHGSWAATASAAGAQTPDSAASGQAQDASAAVPSPRASDAAQARDVNKAAPPKTLHFSPLDLEFSRQSLGTTSSVKVVLISSDVAVKLHDVQAGGDFELDRSTCDIPAQGTCRLLITFAPKQGSDTTSALVVTDPAGVVTVGTTLSGMGGDLCRWGAFGECGPASRLKPIVLLAGLYLLALAVVRWNLVALPTRRLLLAEVEAVEIRVKGLELDHPHRQQRLAPYLALLERIKKGLSIRFWATGFDAWFWSRGEEISSWSKVHEVEEQLVDFYHTEVLRAQLERVESQLRDNPSPVMQNLAGRIDVALSKTVTVLSDVQRSALEEALAFVGAVDARLRNDIQAACGQMPLAPDQCVPLAMRVQAVLDPGANALVVALLAAGTARAPASVPEFADLLAHADAVVLRRYQALAADLATAIAANPAWTADQWKPLLCDRVRPYLDEMVHFESRLRAALDAASGPPVARWRALLSEGLGVMYDRYDTDFASLVAWHNKTMWLTTSGLVLIVALAAALGNGPLFLLGATGGLLSRLSRTLYRQDVQTDYGASWTTLFLSPVVGAITGWAGVLLASLMVKFGILGTLFVGVTWDSSTTVSLSIAFLFGFSERAFDTVLSQLQDKIVNTGGDGKAAAAAVTITTESPLSPAPRDKPYSQVLAASGGSPRYTWSVAAGKLPDGLKFDDDTGQKIVGTPTVKGDFKFSLQVRDQAGAVSKSKEFMISVTAPP